MKINVVTVRSGWILQKIAERICKAAPAKVEMTLSHSPIPGANNFYVDIQNCYHGPIKGNHVGLFTHVHENNMKNVPDHWLTLDHIVCMSEAACIQFAHDGRIYKYNTPVTAKMPGQIPFGFNYQKPNIGIFQRGKYEGKGFYVMKELAQRDIVKEFKWIFAGNDWDEVVDDLYEKTEVIARHDSNLNYPADYLAWYHISDYVLIPSKWEGGPMSLIEAAAMGKQIIGSSVGWVGNEIPVDYWFRSGDVDDLERVLNRIVNTRVKARKKVEELSYADYASYIVDIFEGLQ